MTKDEIAKKWGLYMPSSNTRNAMQEYADQETERLKAEIEYLLTENKMLKQALDESDRKLIICEDTCDIHEQSLKELNKLKEKHKRDAVNFADFICLSGYTLMQKNISENGAMFFINENSIGVCSSELYEQYYKQKFESND